MALQTMTEMEAVLLGWTPPREYKAGTTDNGTPFPAGRSMRICVGTAEHDFDVLKVDKEELDSVHAAVASIPCGEPIRIMFTQRYGQLVCMGVESISVRA